MKFAIVGSTGFVGSNLASSLRSSSVNFICIDRARSVPPHDQNSHYFVDFYDVYSLAKILDGVDCVFHLAGRAHKPVSSSVDEADLFRQANVDILISVVKASQRAGVKRIVFTSSIGVLGARTTGTPFNDTTLPNPVAVYAQSKLAAERFLGSFLGPSSSLEWVILRPTLIYGPHCPGNMAKLIKLFKWLPLIPLGSVTARKSFVSIENFVDVLIVSATSSSVAYQSFVISDGEDFSVSDMASCIISGLGLSPFRLVSLPPTFISFVASLFCLSRLWSQVADELIVDSSAFRRLTGWSPIVSSRKSLQQAASSFRG